MIRRLSFAVVALIAATAPTFAESGPEPELAAMAIRAVGKHKGDYLPAHNFKLEIDGVISGGFHEVTGLGSEVEVIDSASEFKDGDDPITHKRAGKAKYKNIVLKRGFAGDSPLLDWYRKVLAGSTDRKSGSVIYLDRAGQEVLRFNFFEAWPRAHSLSSRFNDATGKLVVSEEIELTFDKIEMTAKK